MLSRILFPQFISASKEINERAAEYWPLVMDVARHNNVKRIVRCSQIMGRSDTEEMSAAQIFYPCMQCADIFFLKVGRTRPVIRAGFRSWGSVQPASIFTLVEPV